tara:strand:- start:365 stop:991 length:627 start_codon:yes stop_codon:yes gene_type:complete
MEEENKYYKLLQWATLNKFKIGILMIASILALVLLAFNNLNNIEAEKDAAVSFEKMIEFLRSGEYFEAIEIAEKLQKHGGNSEYSGLSGLILAQLLVFNKQEAEAEDVLVKIIKSNSKLKLNKIAAARLARLYISQEKFDKASEIAELEFQDNSIFKEINADLEAHRSNKELAIQIYRELIVQAQESGQSPEAFIIKKDNLHQQNNSN